MDADAKRVRVEAELSRLSGDLKDIASRIGDVFATLNANTGPLMAQPVCGTNAPGDQFEKDWSKQHEAICKAGESFVNILNKDFAGGIDKSVELLHGMDVEGGKAIEEATKAGRGRSGSVVEAGRGGGRA